MQEERKTEIETETETGSETAIGTEKENAPERESGSVITVPHQVFSTGVLSMQGFVHVYFICTLEFIFGTWMENSSSLGKGLLEEQFA